jgi:hypothetical protein
MAHVVFNTAAAADQAQIEREVLGALAILPSSDVWMVTILGLDRLAGFLVCVACGEDVIGAWTFERPEQVRPRVLRFLAPALAEG